MCTNENIQERDQNGSRQDLNLRLADWNVRKTTRTHATIRATIRSAKQNVNRCLLMETHIFCFGHMHFGSHTLTFRLDISLARKNMMSKNESTCQLLQRIVYKTIKNKNAKWILAIILKFAKLTGEFYHLCTPEEFAVVQEAKHSQTKSTT